MFKNLKKINFLITKRQRKGLIILSMLLLVGMFLEVFGLGILVPALSIILDPKLADNNPLLSIFRNYLSNFSDQNFLIIFLISIVFVYVIKSLFLVLLTFKQNRFLSNIIAHITNNLFKSYLSQPYSFHLHRNASELIKNIQVETTYLKTFLMSLISIFIEGGFILAIISALIYLEPIGAISIGGFYMFLSLCFLQITKKKLKIWGNLREDLDAKVSKIALEGLSGIKEIIVLSSRKFFINTFSSKILLKARINANHGTLSQIPRFYLELISIIGLVSFIILMILQGKNVTQLITILGVFVAATFRIIPSLNRIIAANQAIKYYKPSLEKIFIEVKNVQTLEIKQASNNFKFSSAIEFRNVSFGFNENHPILNSVNFKIKKGQTVGIIGESGSGKSTLLDLILGLHKPISGDVIIDGKSDLQLSDTWKANIGYVSQTIYLLDDTIRNNIAFGVTLNEINDDRILEVLKLVQLENFIKTLKLGLNSKVGERGVQISGGQRQRIGIARALYNDPQVLVFDEATSALDSITESEIIKSINNNLKDKTIIMVAHRESSLIYSDKIFSLNTLNGHS